MTAGKALKRARGISKRLVRKITAANKAGAPQGSVPCDSEPGLRVECQRREAEQGASESEAKAELREAGASLSAAPLRTRRKARPTTENRPAPKSRAMQGSVPCDSEPGLRVERPAPVPALYINGRPARFRDTVKTGDELLLVFPDEDTHIEPEPIPLAILYEDDDLLAIDKQPFMVVHPTKGHQTGTLANAIAHHMRERGESYKPRFISRLDMNTSGVLLVGKNSYAQSSLAKQGEGGLVEKVYIAVLEGRLEDTLPPSGIIDLPIGRPPTATADPRRSVIPESQGGHPSRTAYEVITTIDAMRDSIPCDSEPGLCVPLTLVRVRLLTGRTHQIRVHFAHYGHPVLGDTLYAPPTDTDIDTGLMRDSAPCDSEPGLRVERQRREAEQGASESEAKAELREAAASLSAAPLRTRRKAWPEQESRPAPKSRAPHEVGVGGGVPRHALHASSLSFTHPTTGAPMHIVAPLPPDIAALIPSNKFPKISS